jgi:hypothetical protein
VRLSTERGDESERPKNEAKEGGSAKNPIFSPRNSLEGETLWMSHRPFLLLDLVSGNAELNFSASHLKDRRLAGRLVP